MKKFTCNTLKACIFLCFFSTISTASFCQKFKYLTAEKNMENWNHSINRKSDGGVVDISYDDKKRNYTATISDAELKNTVLKEINFLDNQTYKFAFFSASKLYMFATDKKESLLKYQVNPETFALIGSPENIFSFDDDVVEYRSVYSADSGYFSILCRHHGKKSNDDNFTGIVFNSAFSTISKYEFSPLIPANEIVAIDFVLSESGTAAVICKGVKQQKKADNEISYSATVSAINGKSLSKLLSGFSVGSNQNLHWSFSKNELVFEGLLGESQKEGFTKMAVGRYNINSGKIEDVTISALSGPEAKFKGNSQSAGQIKEKGIPSNVWLKYAFQGDDNSTFLIYDLSQQSRKMDFGQPGRYTPTYTEYSSAETYVIKLDNEKKPVWFHVISKKQVETAGQRYTGINYILGKDNTLYIFFHDSNDNQEVYADKVRDANMLNIKKSSLACITIKPMGNISKSFLWDNTDAESYMMPGNSIENKSGEVTFIAVKKSKDGYFTLSKLAIAD